MFQPENHVGCCVMPQNGMMFKRVKGIARVKCTLGPLSVSIPSHSFMAAWWTGGSKCKPNPCDGTTDSQEDACGEETESNRALSAVEEASNSRLNMWVFNVQESSIWETEGAERRELICSALSGGITELKPATAEHRWWLVWEPSPAEQMDAAIIILNIWIRYSFDYWIMALDWWTFI